MELYIEDNRPPEHDFRLWCDFDRSSIYLYPEQVAGLDLAEIKQAALYYGGDAAPVWNKALPKMVNLESLYLKGTAGQKVLNMIGELPKLKRLEMATTRRHDPSQMSNLDQLTHLWLEKCVGITRLGLAHSLRDLCVLISPDDSDLDLIEDGFLPNLERIGLSSSTPYKPLLVDSLAPLSKLKNLKKVEIYNLKLADDSIEFFRSLPYLEWVWISGKGVVDEASF